MKQETVSTHSNLKTTKQLQIYFRTYFTLLLLSKHWINSAVCSFLRLLGCWSYEEKINCEYVLFRRQNMVCSSSPIYCNHAPAYQLSVFFSPQHPTPPLPSLLCTWENFTVEIISRKNKHQWLNKLCYHFNVLLKRFCQKKKKIQIRKFN